MNIPPPLLIFAFTISLISAEVTLLRESIVDAKALTLAQGKHTRFSTRINAATHQQDALTTFKGYQYATYYDANRHVCVGRRKLPSDKWEIIRLTDYKFRSHDSHKVTSLGICRADGTLHLAFDHHGGELHYRISQKGAASNPATTKWQPSLFSPTSNSLGKVGQVKRVTYPRFVPTPKGDLLFFHRKGGSGSGDAYLYRYDGQKSAWTTELGKFISKEGPFSGPITSEAPTRNPYINGLSYGGNRLHCTWCWRETPDAASNHDLNYAYSDDHGRTWRNNTGTKIAVAGESFITISSPGLKVVDIPQKCGLSNQDTHYAYPDGSLHVINSYRAQKSRKRVYHHHARSAKGIWTTRALNFKGSRPKLVGAKSGHLFLVFESNNAIEIAKGSPDQNHQSWTWKRIHRQKNSPSGGDGLVDLALWNQYEVLSIFDQERPKRILNYGKREPIDGLPSRILVRDFRLDE